MRKKRKRKKIISLLLFFAGTVSSYAAAGQKNGAGQAYALLSGTVFQESGFALPNAAIALSPEPQAGDAAVKIKKMQAVSDARGEFVFRVPPETMHYSLKVSAKRYQTQEKSVAVEHEERVDVTFQLQTESK